MEVQLQAFLIWALHEVCNQRPAVLPPGEQLLLPFRKQAGWAWQPVWTPWGKEHLLLLPGIKPKLPDRPTGDFARKLTQIVTSDALTGWSGKRLVAMVLYGGECVLIPTSTWLQLKQNKHICENMQNGHEIRLESREVILNVTRGVMRG
jgi:hypothetical protein